MNHAKAIGQLSILAVGLGIGIGTAATAAAAPTMPVDPVPLVPDLPLPAADIPGLDVSISFDGFSLFQSGAAEAETGTGDFAIAFGNDSVAEAGTGVAGVGTSDTAMAFGTDSLAVSGNGNLDTSIASGVSSFAEAGGGDSSSLAGNGDFALYWGPAPSLDDGAIAGWLSETGSNDVAAVFDPFGTAGSLAVAGDGGNFDLGAVFGDALGSTAATGGNFLVDIQPPL
jgi:hypothetical protein